MVSFSQKTEALTSQTVTIGSDEIRYNSYFFKVNGIEVLLTKSERTLIECILNQSGLVATRGMLYDSLYRNTNRPRGIKIVDVLIHKARKKIGAISQEVVNHITVVWGRGYVLAARHTVEETHWGVRRKAEILGRLSRGTATREHCLSEIPFSSNQELDEWIALSKPYGMQGMRVTKIGG